MIIVYGGIGTFIICIVFYILEIYLLQVWMSCSVCSQKLFNNYLIGRESIKLSFNIN